MTTSRKAVAALVSLVAMAGAHAASANVVAAWNFENLPLALTNSPAPSSGSGVANSIGMNLYPTPAVGVTTDDVLLGVAGDTGTNTEANLTQIWRVRAQGTTANPANGWSSLAPIGTQGAVFAANTGGYTGPITVGFDWYSTNQGEANMQLEYTNDGVNWTNVPVTVPAGTADVASLTNLVSPNTVIGSYLQISGGQQWAQGLTATINDPLAANNPNFAFEIVNASTGADCISAKGTPLNNNSGNWRFDNVSINGVPEPTSVASLGLAGATLLGRRRNKSAK
jgi:hypothetical protein